MLVVAKAPVPGVAKTRIAAVVGDVAAGRIAAAALLDTLDAVEETVERSKRVIAVAGDLADAVGAEVLARRLRAWQVVEQRGSVFGDRLVAAHHDASTLDGSPVVQIGMDTPHVTADHLRALAGPLGRRTDAVVGPATDGGWWGLAVRSPLFADVLAGVPMSTSRTCLDTETSLRLAGAHVRRGWRLGDVDTWTDALAVARLIPRSRFAEAVGVVAQQLRGSHAAA